ncbi:MAG: sugar transferase [Pseudomonadota bacterium]
MERLYRGDFEKAYSTSDQVVVRSIGARAVKRAFDIFFGLLLLLVFAPLMLICALLIFLRDGSPIFFVHNRVGRHGQTFGCCKFRTMVRDSDEVLRKVLESDPERKAEWEATQKLADDPRILGAVGRFLRKMSFDELPQLFNVLRGEMSLVGPRPIVRDELSRYGEGAAKYMSVRPGLTGAWQVGGRSSTTYEERVQIDMAYIDKWSLALDISILVKTVKVVLGDKNAA